MVFCEIQTTLPHAFQIEDNKEPGSGKVVRVIDPYGLSPVNKLGHYGISIPKARYKKTMGWYQWGCKSIATPRVHVYVSLKSRFYPLSNSLSTTLPWPLKFVDLGRKYLGIALDN